MSTGVRPGIDDSISNSDELPFFRPHLGPRSRFWRSCSDPTERVGTSTIGIAAIRSGRELQNGFRGQRRKQTCEISFEIRAMSAHLRANFRLINVCAMRGRPKQSTSKRDPLELQPRTQDLVCRMRLVGFGVSAPNVGRARADQMPLIASVCVSCVCSLPESGPRCTALSRITRRPMVRPPAAAAGGGYGAAPAARQPMCARVSCQVQGQVGAREARPGEVLSQQARRKALSGQVRSRDARSTPRSDQVQVVSGEAS